MKRHFLCLAVFLSACGTSLFESLSSNDSPESLKEDAIIAMNENDFDTATARLAALWAQSPSNETAQLYSAALLGQGGVVLFDLIRSTVETLGGNSGIGSSLMDRLAMSSESILGPMTPQRQAKVAEALAILNQAPQPDAVGVFFQKCITASISAVPTLQSIARIDQELNRLKSIMGDFQTPEDSCGSSERTRLDAIGTALTTILDQATFATANLAEVSAILDSCFSTDGALQRSSVLTARLNAIRTTADQGCVQSGPLVVDNVPIPSCVSSQFAEQSSSAHAQDGRIDGCELLFNCAGGNCFE